MLTEQLSGGRGNHLVHFYRADDELAERVGAYLAEALDADGVAIAIATEPHLEGIRHRLAALGVDPADAIEDGRLILLDASATLNKLVIDGQVDRSAFDREVGSTIRAAGKRHSVLRAYGEMVDLLWQDDNIPTAVALETVWDELIAELDFTMLCAYQSEGVPAPEHADARQIICELHSSHETSREFQPEHTAPGAARRFIERALRCWGHDGSVIEDARLLITELVTNAVIHTRSPFSVSIASRSPRLRLAVRDRSSTLPFAGARSTARPTGGRGLRIVAAVADDWGVVTTPPGKTVWAELSAAPLTR